MFVDFIYIFFRRRRKGFDFDDESIRAGFTLSGALFRKKCGALQLGRQTLFFLGKNWGLF